MELGFRKSGHIIYLASIIVMVLLKWTGSSYKDSVMILEMLTEALLSIGC